MSRPRRTTIETSPKHCYHYWLVTIILLLLLFEYLFEKFQQPFRYGKNIFKNILLRVILWNAIQLVCTFLRTVHLIAEIVRCFLWRGGYGKFKSRVSTVKTAKHLFRIYLHLPMFFNVRVIFYGITRSKVILPIVFRASKSHPGGRGRALLAQFIISVPRIQGDPFVRDPAVSTEECLHANLP